MRTSSIPPNAVFPDTLAGHQFAEIFKPKDGRILSDIGIVYCSGFKPGADGRTCSDRRPAPDKTYEGDPFSCNGATLIIGPEYNWCTRCAAGYMQEKLMGIDAEKNPHIHG